MNMTEEELDSLLRHSSGPEEWRIALSQIRAENATLKRDLAEAQDNYRLAHETLGKFVVDFGEVQKQLSTAQATVGLIETVVDKYRIFAIAKVGDSYEVGAMNSFGSKDFIATAPTLTEALEAFKRKIES